MKSQYWIQSNGQSHSGKWMIYADDQGTVVGQFESAEDARGHLSDLGLDVVSIDADGNGSIVEIPIDWIGDGERLTGSRRVIDLIK